MGEGSRVHAGPLQGLGASLEKDVGSKSFTVKLLVKKVEIYKFEVLWAIACALESFEQIPIPLVLGQRSNPTVLSTHRASLAPDSTPL